MWASWIRVQVALGSTSHRAFLSTGYAGIVCSVSALTITEHLLSKLKANVGLQSEGQVLPALERLYIRWILKISVLCNNWYLLERDCRISWFLVGIVT